MIKTFEVTIRREVTVEIPENLQFVYLKDEDDYTEEEFNKVLSGEVHEKIARLISSQLSPIEEITQGYDGDDFVMIEYLIYCAV